METNPSETVQSAVPKPKRTFGRRLFAALLAVLLLGAAAAGGYWYRDNQAKEAEKQANAQVKTLETAIGSLKQQVRSLSGTGDDADDSSGSSTKCTPVRPSDTAVENIEASITSGNTAALEGYMASTVTVVYAASDGLGERTPAQAVSDITSFIGNSLVSWAFTIPASTLSSYGQGSYSKYFPGTAVVGKSSQEKVLSFNFDCSGKISTVFLAAQESLLE